jgi:hypothetical protein
MGARGGMQTRPPENPGAAEAKKWRKIPASYSRASTLSASKSDAHGRKLGDQGNLGILIRGSRNVGKRMSKRHRPHVMRRQGGLVHCHRHRKQSQMRPWSSAPEGAWKIKQGQVQGASRLASSDNHKVEEFVQCWPARLKGKHNLSPSSLQSLHIHLLHGGEGRKALGGNG